MTNVVRAVAAVQPVTNQEFLETVFGRVGWRQAHVTGFPGDPGVGGWWGGRRAGSERALRWLEEPSYNNYYCVSTFWDGDDGVARRVASRFRGQWVVAVDDVGPKVDPNLLRARMPAPNYRLETSPGNEQWGWFLDLPETDLGRAEAMTREMIARGLTADCRDPGMRGVCRYVRLPVGSNGKAVYGGACGTVLRAWDPAPRHTVAEVVEQPWGIVLPAPGSMVATGQGVLDPSVAAQDLVLAAQDELGWVRSETGNRWGYECTCPCVEEHTGGADNGCAYRPGPAGGWVCWHGHCKQMPIMPGVTGARPWDQYYRALERGLVAAGLTPMRVREFADALDDGTDLGRWGAGTGAPMGPRGMFLSEYVFSKPDNAFYSLRSGQLEPRATVNSAWAEALALELEHVGAKGRKVSEPVDRWFFAQGAEARLVDAVTYWPGQERVFEDPETRIVYANRYVRRDLPALAQVRRVLRQEVDPWLAVVKHVLGCEGGRAVCWFLDWLGAVLAEPSLKPGWMPVIAGGQGIGKDIIMQPVIEALGGESNTSSIKADDLASTFTDYAEKRLVCVAELRQTTKGTATGHDQYNRLKWLVDPGKKFLPINPKYARPRNARNICAVFVSSNQTDAVALEEDDRRAFVFVSEAKPWAKVRYQALGRWFDRGGWELVAAWLVQRWGRIGQNRRDNVRASAPHTAGRAKMVDAAGGPVLAWIREGIEGPESDEWPTILSAAQVVANVSRALNNPASGLPRHLRAPTVDGAGHMLARLGAGRLCGGEPVRTKRLGRTRLWAVRNLSHLLPLGPGAVAKLLEENAGAQFTGCEIVSPNFPEHIT